MGESCKKAMRTYIYSPPKFKHSAKLVEVFDEQEAVVFKYRRTFNSVFARFAVWIWDIDWHVQFVAYLKDGDPIYRCAKNAKWFGRPTYRVTNCQTGEEYEVSYRSWQKVVPEFRIANRRTELVVKKEMMDWVRVYDQGKEVARWKMKMTEFYKTHLEIEENCPIQDPAFFVCLFQNIFYVGD